MSKDNRRDSAISWAAADDPIYRTGTMIFFGGMRRATPQTDAPPKSAEEKEDDSPRGERT